MSSFKGDSYFEAHVDDEMDPDYRESSDEDSAESEVPRHMKRLRDGWVLEHHEALSELYTSFKYSGRALFGGAFYQLGTMNEFCNFVFKYTMPGGAT